MLRLVKQYLAIRSYVLRLSQDLARRFGKQSYYSVDQVTQTLLRGKYSASFIAYAHATFCGRKDFDAHYGPLGVSCTYDGLRRTVSKRYLAGQFDFNAATIYRRFRRSDDDGFDESGTGQILGGTGEQ
jgi:hypothetical protein